MDFSKPDNARKINTLKVLSAIRENECTTRAELSRILGINKVSISEIVARLIEEGKVCENGRKDTDSGRPATIVDIDSSSSVILGLVIEKKGAILVSADLKGQIHRMERFPRGRDSRELLGNLNSSIERVCRNQNIEIKALSVVGDGDFTFLSDSFDFPVIYPTPIEAQVRSEEMRAGRNLEGMLFLDIDDRITGAFRTGSGVHVIDTFGKMRISHGRKDVDGMDGTLDAFFSGFAFRNAALSLFGREFTDREILSDSKAITVVNDSLKGFALSLALAIESTGCEGVMLLGPYSDIPDELYARLNTLVQNALSEKRKNTFIFKSLSLDKGRMEGACHIALDECFYKTRLLENLRRIEELDA